MFQQIVLRTHLDYTNWATNRLLKQAAELTPEELNRDFGTADKNVLQTLGHIHAADNLWLARLEGSAAPSSLSAMPLSFEYLQANGLPCSSAGLPTALPLRTNPQTVSSITTPSPDRHLHSRSGSCSCTS